MRKRLLALIGALLVAGSAHAATPFQNVAAAANPGLPGNVRLVANRMTIPTTNVARGWGQGMTVHTAATNISQIGVAYANWFVAVPQETYNPNSGIMKMYVGYNGKCAQLTFNGAQVGILPAGGTLFSDVVKLPFIIPAGATFYTYAWVNVPSTNIYYVNSIRNTTQGLGDNFFTSTTALPDLRCGTPANLSNASYPPVAIYGPGTNVSVVVAGDSIARGIYDGQAADSNYMTGFSSSYLWPTTLPVLNLASSSLKASDYTVNPAYVAQRIKLFKFASTGLVELGTNDIHVGNSSAGATQTSVQAVYNIFPQNTKIIQTTIASEPNSTNSWTTVAGQSADAKQGVLDSFNGSVKSVSIAGQSDYYDTASKLTPGGFWPVSPRSPATVTDAGATSGVNSVSSATANFTLTPLGPSDYGCAFDLAGAGTSGADLVGKYIGSIPDNQHFTISSGTAGTTVTNATLTFAVTAEGTHPCQWGYTLIGPLDLTKLR